MAESINNFDYDKEYRSLVAAFEWVFSMDDPRDSTRQQGDIIDEIYEYGRQFNISDDLIDKAYDQAIGEEYLTKVKEINLWVK